MTFLAAISFNGKDHVQILLITHSVKIHRNMAHDDTFRRRVTMEDAVIRIPSGKQSIFAQLQAGRRNQRDAALTQVRNIDER